MKVHEIKIIPIWYEKIICGKKNWEIRKNDRDYQVNDLLLLKEWTADQGFTGRKSLVKVIDIAKDIPYVEQDIVIMTIGKISLSDYNIMQRKAGDPC